jgi:phosphoglycolate phosphatase
MYLIFDFDGTLVDSFHKAVEKFNLLSEKFHYRKILYSELDSLKNLNSREFIRHLEIPLYKIPKVLRAARKSIQNDMGTLTSFANLPDILQQLVNAGFSLGILTSNSKENVATWLKHQKLTHLFKFIHNESSFFGKKNILRKIIRQYQLNKSEVFYIGDETRDVEAAKLNDIFSVAVTWGFNSEKVLAEYQPHFIARTPDDILTMMHTAS